MQAMAASSATADYTAWTYLDVFALGPQAAWRCRFP
jgi:hypothetical protein